MSLSGFKFRWASWFASSLLLVSPSWVLAQELRAIKPVRIEARTASEEAVNYIYVESHALVIGVSEYSNGWSRLPGVKEDVEEVSAVLQENGFAVTVVEDPTLDELEIAIEDFIFEKGAHPDSRLLIYYAGHGHTMKLAYGGDMGFLVPSDASIPQKGREVRFQRQVLSMQRIEEVAKSTQAKHVLFMFDACFAGSVFLATRAAPAYIELNTKEPVRQFITSGSADQEVPDQSIFRRAFVDALRGKADYDEDGYLTGSELGAYIQKRTAEDWEGRLTPQYGKLQDPNLNKGDFVFELARPEPVEGPLVSVEELEKIPEFDLGALQQQQEKLNKLKRAFAQVEELDKAGGGISIRIQAWEKLIEYADTLGGEGPDFTRLRELAGLKIGKIKKEENKISEEIPNFRIEEEKNEDEKRILASMRDAFNQNRETVKSEQLSNKEKVELWANFLKIFGDDIVSSNLDEQWREQAEGAIVVLKEIQINNSSLEKYNSIISNSREVVGCGFIDFSCPDPLNFPVYDQKFSLEDYKRVKLSASEYPWTSIEMAISNEDSLLVLGSGNVTINKNYKDLPLSMRHVKYLINNDSYEKSVQLPFVNNYALIDLGESHIDFNSSVQKLNISVWDWDAAPPPKENYYNNSGEYVLDFFVYKKDMLVNFEKFLEELYKINENELNIRVNKNIKLN